MPSVSSIRHTDFSAGVDLENSSARLLCINSMFLGFVLALQLSVLDVCNTIHLYKCTKRIDIIFVSKAIFIRRYLQGALGFSIFALSKMN